jgi:hypothetical protein
MKKSNKSKNPTSKTVQKNIAMLHAMATSLTKEDATKEKKEIERLVAKRKRYLDSHVDSLMSKNKNLSPQKAKERAAKEMDDAMLNQSGVVVDAVLFTTLNQEHATWIHGLDQLEGDRPEKVALLAKLRENMRDGVVGIQTAIVCLDGVYYRVNGKHSSSLYLNYGYLFTTPPRVIISFYNVETIQDAVVIYSAFDFRPSSRISNEIYRVHAKSIPSLRRANIPDWVVAACVNGATMYEYSKKWDQVSPYERAKHFIGPQAQFILWVHSNLLSGLQSGKSAYSIITCASVMAEIFGAYHANGDKLLELQTFFKEVRDGVARKNCPSQYLRRVLRSSKVAAVAKQKEVEELHNHLQRRCLVRVALNAHLTGQGFKSYKAYLKLCIDGDLPEYLDIEEE